jgi:hypothetical protein
LKNPVPLARLGKSPPVLLYWTSVVM